MFDLDALAYADAALAALASGADAPRDRRRTRQVSGPAPDRRAAPATCPYAAERAA